mmetsp:Transcript_62402/g.72589  ORF Transcript_62402/g.72589 Transcript_62402/m.72589 type:complete len:209 (-) Transcript_62402:28-654(-)
MEREHYDYLIKFIIIGNSSTGKSCLMHYFIENKSKKSTTHTIGVEFGSKVLQIGAKSIKLQIWDTAGQERFKTITSSYYKGAHGVVIAYDITNKQSLKDVDNWLAEVEKHAHPKINKLLIGNKCDLENERQVPYEEGKKKADELGIKFIETSAKDTVNVDSVFFTLANEIKERMQIENPGGKDKASKGAADDRRQLVGGKKVQQGGCC